MSQTCTHMTIMPEFNMTRLRSSSIAACYKFMMRSPSTSPSKRDRPCSLSLKAIAHQIVSDTHGCTLKR
ncbi:MAG: hypothetical protein AAGD25_03170 [Cyanobacteria bacterium P01_F01_bin.150]